MPHLHPRPHDVLRSPQPPAPGARLRELVDGRRVLVTGAAGALGDAVVRRLLTLRPAVVHRLDVDARSLHAQQLALAGRMSDEGMLLADVRDARALDAAFRHTGPDVVVHAAGLAHVALAERFTCAAVMANVWGTQNVVEAAHRHGVTALVHVSSAEAADPTTVLGATQRLAETIVRGGDGLRAASVRCGTGLGGPGSLWDDLTHQVAAGASVRVDDPDATRTFLTLDDAAARVLEAGALAGGGTYVVDAGERMRVRDLVARYAAAAGVPAPDVAATGPGTWGDEVLVGPDERPRDTGVDGVRRCPASPAPPGFDRVLAQLYAAADEADDAQVRDLLAQRFAGLRGRDDASPDDHVPRSGTRPVLRLVGVSA